MTLETIDFLRRYGLEALRREFHICANRHKQYPNLVLLKYDQRASPMQERIVQECRGLILDESGEWRIVSFPYAKFFNYNEPNAACIDWGTAKVYEKLDGSLVTLYWYDDQWHVATSGTPDAGGDAHGSGNSFRAIFWRVWNGLGYEMPKVRGMSYMFELMTPANRVIVPHCKSRIALHGVRDLRSLQEHEPEPYAEMHGWECCPTHPLTTADECLEAVRFMDPMLSEGYVVCDAKFNRLKVKCPAYVALAHMKDGMTPRRVLDIVRKGEASEVVANFPEWREAFRRVQDQFDVVASEIERAYVDCSHIADRRAFAEAAKETRFPAALFAMKDGKADGARHYLANSTMQAVERLIHVPGDLLLPGIAL